MYWAQLRNRRGICNDKKMSAAVLENTTTQGKIEMPEGNLSPSMRIQMCTSQVCAEEGWAMGEHWSRQTDHE